MKKIVLIVAGVVVVAAAAFGAYTLLNKDNNNNETQNQSTSETAPADSDNPTFNPTALTDQSFIANMTTTTGDKTLKAVIKSDGQGNLEYAGTINGAKSQLFFTKDAYYACTNGLCIKFPASQAGNASVDPSKYQYDQSQIDAWRAASTYQGQQACGDATCDVWKTTSDSGAVTIFVDSANKRIVKLVTSVDGGEMTIEYEYTDVTITPPKNARTLPSAN